MSFARVLTQMIMVGTSIVSKAFMQAYAQAKQGGGQAARAAAQAGRMPSDQAREVLQVAKGPLSREEIMAQFTKYYESNDPEKGGSFYIQSKVFNAKEALIEDLKKQERMAAAAAAKASSTSSSSSTGGSSDKFSGLRSEHAGLFGGSGASSFSSGGKRWMHTSTAGREGVQLR